MKQKSALILAIGLLVTGCTTQPVATKSAPKLSLDDQIRAIEMSDRPPAAKQKAIEKLRAGTQSGS